MQAVGVAKPVFFNKSFAEDSQHPLMTMEELAAWLDANKNDLWWDNTERLTTANTLDSKDNEEFVYRGFRHKINSADWQGIGIIQYKDGAVYRGETHNQLYNGKGRLTHASGDVYHGKWLDGKAQGHGIYLSKDSGTLYEGEWFDDEQHGHGTELYQFGKVKYEGNYVRGEKTGKGKFTTHGGHHYEGEFKGGKFHG